MKKFDFIKILFFLVLTPGLGCTFLYSQTTEFEDNMEFINFYSYLFFNERSENVYQGTLQLPGNFPKPNYDLKTNLISFTKNFTLKYPNANASLIIENGFSDQGMILINGKFIDSQVINSSEGYTQTLPADILNEGSNTISLLAIFHSPLWSFNGDIYIENGLEQIYLNGDWDYTEHKNLENNFQRRPTQGLDVLSFIDFDLKQYTAKSSIDRDWSKTDFPVTIESLYNNKNLNGTFCFRKTITFNEQPTEDYFLSISKGIDDYDRFYVNGMLVGSTDCFSCRRHYRIPKEYLQKENLFTFFVVDKDGPGGISGPIFLNNKERSIDISNQWSFTKLQEMQMLVTLKNTNDENSFFTKSDFKFYDLTGNELSFDNLLVKDTEGVAFGGILLLTVVVIAGIFIFLYYKPLRKEKPQQEQKSKDADNHKFIFIRADRADHKVYFSDILSVEGKKDYVKLKLESKSYLIRKNLKTFLKDLPEAQFERISKSVAINLEKISKIEKNIIYLNSDTYHIISKSYVKDINELLINK